MAPIARRYRDAIGAVKIRIINLRQWLKTKKLNIRDRIRWAMKKQALNMIKRKRRIKNKIFKKESEPCFWDEKIDEGIMGPDRANKKVEKSNGGR